jgi:hypothetical protein
LLKNLKLLLKLLCGGSTIPLDSLTRFLVDRQPITTLFQ